jgi:hypothetical protein
MEARVFETPYRGPDHEGLLRGKRQLESTIAYCDEKIDECLAERRRLIEQRSLAVDELDYVLRELEQHYGGAAPE